MSAPDGTSGGGCPGRQTSRPATPDDDELPARDGGPTVYASSYLNDTFTFAR